MNRTGRVLLVVALVGVVAMAFRVSWNALRDVAAATGADPVAALLYPIVVDGLMALALIATLVLVDDDRRFALRILATYTLASLVLNYVHGLMPDLAADSLHWPLVLLATSLPVGSIYFGSDLVAKVLHHRPVDSAHAEESAQTEAKRSRSDLGVSTPDAITAEVERPALAAVPAEPTPLPVDVPRSTPVVAAESTRPPRATGRVPDVARTPRPTRTADELLAEARSATADWPIADLTAEGIRKAVRTSPAKARVLRETLRAERSGGGADAVAVA